MFKMQYDYSSSYVIFHLFQGTLAAVDAGWSGDWSRIGVITVEMEAQLRDFTLFVAVGHSVTAAITVWVAQNGGYNLGVAAAKVGSSCAGGVGWPARLGGCGSGMYADMACNSFTNKGLQSP